MKVHIITIGDEILIGQTVNSNAAFIGEKLTNLGLSVIKSSVVKDDIHPIIKEFESAYANNDLVIVTGGLGPTNDDITKMCITNFFNTELIEDEKTLQNIKEYFEQKDQDLLDVNRAQALIPKVAIPIKNKLGTAPGLWIEKENKIFIALPGVPYEMEAMISDFVVPRLKGKIEDMDDIGVSQRTNLLTTGIPESVLFEKLGDINELMGDVNIAFLPNQFGVKIRLTANGESEQETNDKLIEVEQKVRSKIGRFIFGKGNDTLEAVVAKLLTERDLKIAVAESCTGGLISSRLTNIAGSSKYFERGVITYSNAAKVEILKVDEDLIQDKGAVSLDVARQMAEGIKAISGTDIGLAVTGIMGPDGGTKDKPVGTVFIGICDEKVCTAIEFHFGNDRLLNKDRTSQTALNVLRQNLLGISYDE